MPCFINQSLSIHLYLYKALSTNQKIFLTILPRTELLVFHWRGEVLLYHQRLILVEGEMGQQREVVVTVTVAGRVYPLDRQRHSITFLLKFQISTTTTRNHFLFEPGREVKFEYQADKMRAFLAGTGWLLLLYLDFVL